MKLLPLTNDFTFKAVFSKDEDVLIDLLNSFPEFQGTNQITYIKILNPEMPRDMKIDKAIVLLGSTKAGKTTLLHLIAKSTLKGEYN